MSVLLLIVISIFFWLCGPGAQNEEPLGRHVETNAPFDLSPEELAKHCYLIGSTGCGKTSMILLLIEEDLKRGHSVVIVDMRGDLVAKVLALCASLDIPPKRVNLLDLREEKRIQGFNPLAGAGKPYIKALHVLDVIASENESWGVQLEETMRSGFLLLADAGEPLTKLEAILYDRPYRLRLMGQCRDESLVAFWIRYDALSAEKQNAWALPVLNKVTSLMAVPSLRAMLSSEDCLNLQEILDTQGSVLLVSLAVDELQRSGRMVGSLLISSITREMMARVNVPEPLRNPVRLYVDEFENFACSAFESLIAEGRRFALTLVLSHQTLAQLQPKLRAVIRNNVGRQIIFQCGFDDARLIARELPEESSIQDIRRLRTGRAIVLRRSGKISTVQFREPRRLRQSMAVRAYRERVLPKPKSDSQKAAAIDSPGVNGPDLEDLL